MPAKKGTQANTGRTHFKKGFTPWNKGKKMSKEHCEKMSQIMKTHTNSGQFKKGHTVNLGTKRSQETIRKMKKAQLKYTKYALGYVFIYMPEYPFCDKFGYIQEHRYIMATYIGRPIKPNERVHHLNGIKHDNRIETLNFSLTNQEHQKVHHPKGFKCSEHIVI